MLKFTELNGESIYLHRDEISAIRLPIKGGIELGGAVIVCANRNYEVQESVEEVLHRRSTGPFV